MNQEERFSNALYRAAHGWRQAIDRRLRFLNVSQASWMTLAVVATARTPLSQSELAQRLSVEDATMVAMIDRLGKTGWVLRETCSTDRRVKRVVITEAGRRLYEAVKAEAATACRQLLATIDPQKLQAAIELLEDIAKRCSALA